MKKLIGRRMLSLLLSLLMCISLSSVNLVSAQEPTPGIQSVTGITTVMTFGQKVTAIAVEYSAIVDPQPIEDPANLDTYTVKDSWYDFRFDNVSRITSDIRNRTITRIYTNDEPATIPNGVSKPGRFVIVELSPLDYGGNTVRTNPASSSFVKIMTGTTDMQTQIIQNKAVLTADGEVLQTPTVYRPSAWLDPLADQFQFGVYCCQGTGPGAVNLPYYYYIPPDLEPGHVYPMVVILPGQGMGFYNGTNPIGLNPKVNVVADIPATAWLQPAWKGTDEKVIVLAPQNRRTQAAAEATAVLGLLDQFIAAHPEVDASRLYFSTVSYGSTTAWAMMQQRPGVFTSGLLTGGFAVSAAQATAIATARPLTPIYITHGTFDHLLNVATTGRVSRDRLRSAYVATGLVNAAGTATLIPYQEYDTPPFINQVVPQIPGYAEPDNHAVMGPTYADTSKLTWLLSQVKYKVSVNPVNVQYSDPVTLQASVSPANANGHIATGSVEFFVNGTSVGSNAIDASGTATLSLPGTYTPGSYNITARFTRTNSIYSGSSGGPAALTVTQEDAVAAYSGDMLAFTTSGGSTANVLLRATVLDSDDGYPGDIRNATVTFKEGTTTICGPLPVALMNGSTTTGTASCTASLGLGAHTIDVYVGNYYFGTTSGVVEVAQPNGSFITGGGFLNVGTSGGTYLADPGSRSSFGFNVNYRNLKSLQGHVNIIFRAGGHTYQIKSTAIDSLGIAFKTASGSTCSGPVSSTCFGLADFRSKANLTDVTNPLAPISLGGNLTLQVTITDKGDSGSSDTVAFTLWSGNQLLFSSEWDGTKTLEQILGGGNLVVH